MSTPAAVGAPPWETSGPPASAGVGSEVYDVEQVLAGSREVTPDAPRGPFVLVFLPETWTVVNDGILPQLGECPLIPGVANVKGQRDPVTGETRWNLDIFDLRLRAKGGYRIPVNACCAEDTPDGKPGYIRRRRLGGQHYYHTPWETIDAVGTRAVIRTDSAGYWRWVARLLDRGVIPKPDPSIVARMADRARAIADAASGRSDDASKRVHAAQTAVADRLIALLSASATVGDPETYDLNIGEG